MKPIKLRVVSDKGTEATIYCDGSQGGAADFYSVVSVNDFLEDKKVYGIDPIQSFSIGMKLIEQLTEDRRIGNDETDLIPGTSWKIEVVDC